MGLKAIQEAGVSDERVGAGLRGRYMGGSGCDLMQLAKGAHPHREEPWGRPLGREEAQAAHAEGPPVCKEDTSKEKCYAVRKGLKLTREQKSHYLTGKRGAPGASRHVPPTMACPFHSSRRAQ